MKDIYSIPSRINAKKITSKHFMGKLMKTKNKGKVLKAIRKERYITSIRATLRLTTDSTI